MKKLLSDLFRFFLSKAFWFSLFLALLLGAGLIWFSFSYLNSYTNHEESITVPDFKGMTISQLDDYLESHPLRYAVNDSSFNKDMAPNAIINQNPLPGQRVKENRRIYLTVNSNIPPMVKMPKIIDSSLKNAKIQLNGVDLKIGDTKYVPFIGKNVVLKASVDGKPINSGEKLRKGTEIDLELGDGHGNQSISIPSFIGQTYLEAQVALRLMSLSVGKVILDDDVDDPKSSFVYQQYPSPDPRGLGKISLGQPIDLYLQKEPMMMNNGFDDSEVLDFNKEKESSDDLIDTLKKLQKQ